MRNKKIAVTILKLLKWRWLSFYSSSSQNFLPKPACSPINQISLAILNRIPSSPQTTTLSSHKRLYHSPYYLFIFFFQLAPKLKKISQISHLRPLKLALQETPKKNISPCQPNTPPLHLLLLRLQKTLIHNS